MKILNFFCESGPNFTTCYLSSRKWRKSVTCFESSLNERDRGVAALLWSIVIMMILYCIGEAERGFTPCYLSPWPQLKGIASFGTSLKGRDGGVSVWIVTTWVTLNFDYTDEAVASFATCYLTWMTELNPVAIFGTNFREWWVNPAAGPAIVWAFWALSSGIRRAIMVENFLYDSKIFEYSWSLLRSCRNRLVHAMNGNLFSGRPRTNNSRRKTKGFNQCGSLIAGFFWIFLVLWMAMGFWKIKFMFGPLDQGNSGDFASFWIDLPHFILSLWLLFAFEALCQVFMEVGC